MHQDDPKLAQRFNTLLFLILAVLIVVGATVLARRNYLRGRGDRQGAFRLACVVFVLAISLWICQGHFVPSFKVIDALLLAMSAALFYAGFVWVLYLSLEPYVRRRWPQSLISWSRLLMGKIRDPLLGRDVLFGVALAALWLLIFQVNQLLQMRIGQGPRLYSGTYLLSARSALGVWLSNIPNTIQGTLLFFFLLFVLRVILRRGWLAGAVFVAICTAQNVLGSDRPLIDAACIMVIYAIVAIVVLRVGLVALAIAIFSTNILGNVPFTMDFSIWYFGNTLFPLLTVVALAVWGFYTALAGQKLWNVDAFN